MSQWKPKQQRNKERAGKTIRELRQHLDKRRRILQTFSQIATEKMLNTVQPELVIPTDEQRLAAYLLLEELDQTNQLTRPELLALGLSSEEIDELGLPLDWAALLPKKD